MEMLEFVVPALNVKAILPQVILSLTALTVLLVVFSARRIRKRLLLAIFPWLGWSLP